MKKGSCIRSLFLAERMGFEPMEPFGSRALQARALDRTMLPLHECGDYSITGRFYKLYVVKKRPDLAGSGHSLFSRPLPELF